MGKLEEALSDLTGRRIRDVLWAPTDCCMPPDAIDIRPDDSLLVNRLGFVSFFFLLVKRFGSASRACVLVEMQLPQEAIADCSSVLSRDSHSELAWANRAAAHFQLCAFQSAYDDYSEALALNPEVSRNI